LSATAETREPARRAAARPRRRALIIALALVATWPLLAWCAAAWLAAGPTQDGEGLARADAVLVLAGSSTYVERAQAAAALYARARAPKVVLTNDDLKGGWSAAEERNPLFVERAAEELRRGGRAGG
jgi:hypothetical protein